MTPDMAAEIIRQLLKESMIVATPVLAATVIISFVLSLLQTLTSLQDQSLTSVPRLFVVVGLLAVAMPWFIHRLTGYTHVLYDNLGRYTH